MYSKIKRVLCAALLAVLCMTIICGSAATERKPSEPLPPLQTIMSINAKTTNPLSEQNPTDNLISKDDAITYSYNEDGEGPILGPTDYKLIDSDRFCVLDTHGKYIRTYSIEKSAMINSIDISCCEYPNRVAYKDGIYYVYDIDRKEIFTFAEAGTLLGVIPLPNIGAESDYSPFEKYDSKELALFGADLVNHDGEIMLLLAPDGVYVHNDYRLVGNEFVECEPVYTRITDVDAYDEMLRDPSRERTRMTTITYGGHSWTLDAFGVGIDILGVDEDNNLYLYCVAHLSGPDGFMIKGTSVRVYDANSNLVGGVELNLDEFRMFPIASARMDEDNNLYFLAGTDDEMRLMKINTQEEYEVNNEELYKAIDEDIQACSEMPPERGLSPTRTRTAAYNTAKPYVSYSYTVTPKNAHARNDCILHL